MISVPEGTPWWAWLIVAFMIYVIPEMVALRRKVQGQAREVKAQSIAMGRVHHQVANEHETNLRDDIDVVGSDAQKAAGASERAEQAAMIASETALRVEQAVAFLMEDSRTSKKDIGGIREDMRMMSRKIDSTREALTDHLLEGKNDRT